VSGAGLPAGLSINASTGLILAAVARCGACKPAV
jgi:hypothetical protein